MKLSTLYDILLLLATKSDPFKVLPTAKMYPKCDLFEVFQLFLIIHVDAILQFLLS